MNFEPQLIKVYPVGYSWVFHWGKYMDDFNLALMDSVHFGWVAEGNISIATMDRIIKQYHFGRVPYENI